MATPPPTTLRPEHFDDLWPTNLSACESEFQHMVQFFEPERKFDMVWAHTFLAEKCFKDYELPPEFVEPKDERQLAREAGKFPSSEASSHISSRSSEHCFTKRPEPKNITEQIKTLRDDQTEREQLVQTFGNMKWPWYMDKPLTEQFKDWTLIKKHFITGQESDLISNIYHHKCKLLILDLGLSIDFNYMERWQKFGCYVNVVVVVHDEKLASKAAILGKNFHSVYLEQQEAYTWQDELNRSLEAGVQYAQERKFYTDCHQAVIFVFSNERGMKKCDKFRILRKY